MVPPLRLPPARPLRPLAAGMALASSALAFTAMAQQPAPTLSAQDSDPAKLGWMVGSPPPRDKQIRKDDGSSYRFPQFRWTFSNMRRFGPSANISRGVLPPAPLPRAERDDLDAVTFTPLGASQPMTWGQAYDANYTDGIVVLHKGRVVYERYSGVFTPQGQHIAQSVTKSFFGLIAASLIAEGKLDDQATVAHYVPELKDSGFADATVRDVMDMRTGIQYSEDYTNPNAEIWAHVRSGDLLPRPPGYQGPKSFYDFLKTVKKQGEHGGDFAYKTVNTDVLGWVIRRVTGQSVADALSTRIWSKLGMEQDAYMYVDAEGTEFAGGGLNTGLRDLARFGELVRNGGEWNGQQIVPRAAIEDIRRGGDKAAFAKAHYATKPGWSYRSMWWVSHNGDGAFAAMGIHGQVVYVDPKAEMVIARYASHPIAGNAGIDPTSLPAYDAIAQHLMQHPR